MVDIEVLKELLQYLISLTEPGAKLVYSLAYKKALFYGYSNLIFGVLSLFVVSFLQGRLKRAKSNDEDESVIGAFVGLKIVVLLFSLISLYFSADWFVNTELKSMEIILKMLPR